MISWSKPGILSPENRFRPLFVLANVLVMTFLSVLSAVTTIIADNSIQGELALSAPKAVWLTTLYLLGVNTIVPISSWFAERFGYKTMYSIGLAIFSVSSGLAGLSENFAAIAIARALEGVGAGFIFPLGLAIIIKTLPEKKISLGLILYVAASFGAGFALGFPLAGYFSQFLSWRYIFFLMLPVGILGNIACWLIHEESERKKTSRFDAFGFLFFATFIATLLIALTYGPLPSTDGGWRSPYIIGLFAIAAICLIATIWVESRHEDPILPIVLFKDPFFVLACVAMWLLGMSIFASAGTLMQYMINALSYEKYVSGQVGIIYGVSLFAFSILANLAIKKVPMPIITFIGLSILVFSYFLNNQLSIFTGVNQVFLILLLRGIGVGLSFGPTTIQAIRHVPKELTGKGATILTFFRQVGGTYGGTLIAIVTIKRQIFHTARFAEQVNEQLPAYQVAYRKLLSHFYTSVSDKGIESSLQAKGVIIRNIEIQAYIQSLNDAMIVFGYVTAVVAVLLASLSLWEWSKRRLKSAPNL